MSLCCMVLYHPSVTTQTKSLIVRSMFQTELIEIEVLDAARMAVFLEEVERERIWQVTANLESAEILTVYAFGEAKEEILLEALFHLKKDITSNYHGLAGSNTPTSRI